MMFFSGYCGVLKIGEVASRDLGRVFQLTNKENPVSCSRVLACCDCKVSCLLLFIKKEWLVSLDGCSRHCASMGIYVAGYQVSFPFVICLASNEIHGMVAALTEVGGSTIVDEMLLSHCCLGKEMTPRAIWSLHNKSSHHWLLGHAKLSTSNLSLLPIYYISRLFRISWILPFGSAWPSWIDGFAWKYDLFAIKELVPWFSKYMFPHLKYFGVFGYFLKYRCLKIWEDHIFFI
ncbi:hypothetical protein V6N12_035696 [Hibiscus sabdariffa]|uniref:Uncharacterized protein n=1 Tax=Hibiscus sabdariffa TaxID=183260 RepID=A0ABR2ENG7_9ROSI